jgi:hypothetical protein
MLDQLGERAARRRCTQHLSAELEVQAARAAKLAAKVTTGARTGRCGTAVPGRDRVNVEISAS